MAQLSDLMELSTMQSKMACEKKTQSEIPVILPIEFPSVHPGSVLSALKCRATLGQGNWLFLNPIFWQGLVLSSPYKCWRKTLTVL